MNFTAIEQNDISSDNQNSNSEMEYKSNLHFSI